MQLYRANEISAQSEHQDESHVSLFKWRRIVWISVSLTLGVCERWKKTRKPRVGARTKTTKLEFKWFLSSTSECKHRKDTQLIKMNRKCPGDDRPIKLWVFFAHLSAKCLSRRWVETQRKNKAKSNEVSWEGWRRRICLRTMCRRETFFHMLITIHNSEWIWVSAWRKQQSNT